ncbi:MAG: TonB-dependent receptor [Ignavibacteriales bacterium]|nr:TonB-dependent receptor [Ignavibacteriales bacterium]
MKNIFIITLLLNSWTVIFPQTKLDPAGKDSITYQLNPITISATRYPEQILEIPYAVSIINKNQLTKLKGYGLDEILNSVPGVLAQSRSGNQDVRLMIRGFGARGAGDRSNSGTSRGLRVMVDGFPETEPDGRTSFDNIDLSLADNIEIIRSNSSALWGNASGGIINISSIPYIEKAFVNAQGYLGSFGFKKYTFQSGARLGNGIVAASFSSNTFEGWRKHSGSKRSIFNLGFISNLEENSKHGVYLTGSSNVFHIPGPLTLDQYNSDPKQANPTYEKRDERRYNRTGRIGVTFEHNFNSNHLISVMAFVNPKYLQRSERGTFRDFTRYHVGGNVLYNQSYKFSESLNNKLILGLDEAYQDGAILFYSLSNTNNRGNELTSNKREGANNFGAFLQDEINIADDVSILIGGRLDNIAYFSEDFLDPKLGLQEKSFKHFTPKAGITYRLTPTHSIYANLGGGVEVPAGNETDPAGTYGQDTVYLINPLLEPITSTTFEAGTKQIIIFNSEEFIQSLNYDLALYYINIKNDIIPYRGGRFYFAAGKTTRSGAEFGLNLQLKNGISFQTSFTYSINKYNEYLVDSVHYGVPGKVADYKDNKVAGIPDLFYSASISYSPDYMKGVFLSFSTNGIGKYFVDDANKTEVPAYNIFNASIGILNDLKIGNLFSVKGFLSVNNITDKKYVGSAFINPDLIAGKAVYIEPGLPRNFTASICIAIK